MIFKDDDDEFVVEYCFGFKYQFVLSSLRHRKCDEI